jgi:FMNH2-dependent dimethyl sulfone monooxygenase
MRRDGTVDKRSTPILGSASRLKLAVFGTNVSGGCSCTAAEGTFEGDWDEAVRIAQAADRAGIEAIIPIARWRGYGGEVNFNDRCFETFTWAAGMAALTERIQVFATFHIPTCHPVRGAKESATIDHISGGRFGLNTVAGWNQGELSMFGHTQLPHDERYQVSDEWMTFTKRLWTEDTFDFEGRYYDSPGAHSEPKPVQAPYPVVMSAGASPAGEAFAAKHADIHFIALRNLDGARERIATAKANARERHGREISVMGRGYIMCADTEREARDYYDHVVNQKGDWVGVRNLIDGLMANSKSADYDKMGPNMIAGHGALPLIGTPEQVVEGMLEMADAGLDGITVSWVDYEEGLRHYQEVLLPLLVEAGVRAPADQPSLAPAA